MEDHKHSVDSIAFQVREFYQTKTPFRIYHGSTNSTRNSQFKPGAIIDTSLLSKVLKVDVETKTALVEPNVPMDDLVESTLEFGLIPPVVMEFPGITAGGGFSGTSAESSSFRYGFFENTVKSVELILGNGDVVEASDSLNSDLFYGAASSCGTLGVVTLLELALIDAKPFVELTYQPVSSISEAVQLIETSALKPHIDYIDGIFFAKDRGVLCIGHATNTASQGSKYQQFTRPHDPWFYRHVEKLLHKGKVPLTETVPLVDYLFRYDRGAFWTGRYAFKYFLTPFNRVTRWALDWFMHTRVMYHALHKSGHGDRYIVQDVAVPYSTATEFMNYIDDLFGIYPIWLCPLRVRHGSRMSSVPAGNFGAINSDMLLNFGIWGPGPSRLDRFVDMNRKLEDKVQHLKGRKFLYAHAYYTEEEFWEIYNRAMYDALRSKYHADYLPTMYDKVKVDVEAKKKARSASWITWILALFWSIWPLSGVYGVLQAMFGGDYLLPSSQQKSKSKQKIT